MSNKIDPVTALSQVKNICARQEQCKQDIREKLGKWGLTGEETAQIISELEKEGFVDEQRYAGMFTREKFRLNKWGRIKLRYMLKQKHIPGTVIDNALDELNDEEYRGLLLEELQKKNKTLRQRDQKAARNQLIRFAMQRGFEYEMIQEVLKELYKSDYQ
jgi:regulatory protein